MIQVLLVDDQALFRLMLEEVLKSDTEIEVVDLASDGEMAVLLAIQHQPDIVLMDMQMPKKNGVEALAEIKKEVPRSKVIMLTTFEDSESITAAYLAGADGYLVKDIKPDILKMSIKCIYHNLAVIHQSAYQYLKQDYSHQYNKNAQKEIRIGDMILTGMDIEIIKLIAAGRSNKDIAARLNYSEGTIKNKITNILNLSGLTDRTQVAVFAIKNSII